MPVNGAIWSIGEAEDVGVGLNENQTISEIKSRNGDEDIKIRVGDMIKKGVEFDSRNTSYTISDRESVSDSDAYIKNRNSENATIIVDKSVPDGSGFDLQISNIDTSNVSIYDEMLSEKETRIEYKIEQGFSERYVQFGMNSSAQVSLQNNAYNDKSETVSLDKVRMNNDTDHIVIWERSSNGQLIQRLGSSQGYDDSVNITSESVTGETELAATIHPGKSEPDTDVIYAADNQFVQFPVVIKTVQSPRHYVNNSFQEQQADSYLSVVFNTKISSKSGNISVEFFDQPTLAISLSEDKDMYSINNSEIIIPLDSTDTASDNEPLYVEQAIYKDIESKENKSSFSKIGVTPNRVEYFIENETNITAEQGSYIGLNATKNTSISRHSEEQSLQQNPIDHRGEINIINTTSLPEGEYIIQSETRINQTQIQIDNTSLPPSVPTTSVKRGIVAKTGFINTSKKFLADVYKGSNIINNLVIETETDSNNSTINISESGEYRVEFKNIESGETSEKTVRVLENKDIKSNLPVSARSVDSGQILPINISSTYNSTVVCVRNKDTNTTAATIELATPEKGETTVEFNTYLAANGSLNESLSVTGPGASIESINTTGENATLRPGTYELAIRSEQGIAATSDNTTVTLGERSTNGLTVYAGTDAVRSDLGNATAVRDAVEAGGLSRSDHVAANDTVVYAVNASGLTGLPAARNATLETGGDLDRLDGLEFGVRSTGTEDDLNTSDAVGEMPADSTVHVDETGLYVVADGDDALPTDGEPEPGEEFTAAFRVTDGHLSEIASDPPDGHRVTSTVAVAGTEGDSTSGDDDRTGSGDPAESGSGTDGESAGTGGGTGGTGSAAGGSPSPGSAGGGSVGGSSAGGDASDESNAGDAAAADETADGIGPDRGVGLWSRPSAEDRTPPFHGPTAVSTPTTGGGEASDGPGARESGSPAIDPDAADAGGGSSKGPSDESGGSERATPSYENAPIRATAEDVPGFGPLQSLAALALTLLAAARARRGR